MRTTCATSASTFRSGRLTVFTGVSGSGKSSLVFETIAAESRRLIDETYTTFVQGFMPTRARPDVDSLENLTASIIVDQERMGANARSTVGTATDAYDLLRVIYSRLGQPNVGPSSAFSFNVPAGTISGEITLEKGRSETEARQITITGGMCAECEGLGRKATVDIDALVDKSKSLNEGAITFPGFQPGTWYHRIYTESGFFNADEPLRDFTDAEWERLLYGEETKVKLQSINLTYLGLVEKIRRAYLVKDLDSLQPNVRAAVERISTTSACPSCDGTRLNATARSSVIRGKNIAECAAMQISDLAVFLRGIDDPSTAPIVGALRETLESMVHIGLGYLSLDRESSTLSGGEAQRTKMVRHLGSALTDVTYVFDEPTIGLHAHDVQQMNALLQRLRDKGNTVLVVEHEPEVIRIADHVVDMGPRAGSHGGEVVFQGPFDGLGASGTLTGRHLEQQQELKTSARTPRGAIPIRNATLHNLQDVSVDVPTGVLVAVTGVAGSGKSSLIHGCMPRIDPSVTVIDQAAIRGSRRSNPATYTGILEPIRKAFASANKVKPALFSANSEGACPECKGLGLIYTDLAFMAGVVSVCEVCEGRRFTDEVLGYQPPRQEHRRGARPVRRGGSRLLHREAGGGDARPAGRRGPRLHLVGPDAQYPVGRGAAAAEARDRDERRHRCVRVGRANLGAAHARRRQPHRSARPPRRLWADGDRDRAQPRRGGAGRLGHRPRAGRRPRRRSRRIRGAARGSGACPGDPHRRAPAAAAGGCGRRVTRPEDYGSARRR